METQKPRNCNGSRRCRCIGEVYRAEDMELRAGARIRRTRNDAGLGLVDSRTAEVLAVGKRAGDVRPGGREEAPTGSERPPVRHLDHAWASTVHAFQGRTVNDVIGATEARHAHLTTQKSPYAEINRARARAELVTDNAAELRAQLQAVTGERVAALEGIGEMRREARDRSAGVGRGHELRRDDGMGKAAGKDRETAKAPVKGPEAPVHERGRGGMDLRL